MSYQSTHTCRVEDKSGEMLLCEFRVFDAPQHLQIQRDEEITLKSVTFRDGQGVECKSDHAHAQFVVLMRDDKNFEDHMYWTDIEEKCAQAYMLGHSNRKPETFAESIA